MIAAMLARRECWLSVATSAAATVVIALKS